MMMEVSKLKEYNLTDQSLRPYQRVNKERIYDAWLTCQSVMLQMPTGTGKTRLFVSIIKDIFNYSKDTKHAYKVLILVHRKELVDQIDEELGCRYGLAHGIIQSGDRERKHYPIQIASVQTLSRRLEKWTDKDFDFVIIDEAHHTTAKSYQLIIKAFPDAKLLGVTATPCRLSGEGFTGTFERLILSAPISKFIEDGYLSQYNYYSVRRTSFIQRQIDGIKKFTNGDYAESEIERICDNDHIRAQVVNTYIKYAEGKKGIVYTINKEHNKHLCEEFNSHGFLTVALDSDSPKSIREEAIEDFKRGKIQIICNVNLFSEGFDCPDIEFIQLARPTQSLSMYLQQVGRGLRKSENKENTIILDNVGLYNKFGLPKAKRNWQKHFEGEFISKTEIENAKKKSTENSQKRKRHQNFQEGNEEVFYIYDPDEEKYLQERANHFWDILNEYYECQLVSIVEAIFHHPFLDILNFDFKKERNRCLIDIKEETLSAQANDALDKMLTTRLFNFYNNNQPEYRLARNKKELLDKIIEGLCLKASKERRKKANSCINNLIKLNFSFDEMSDILYETDECVCSDEKYSLVFIHRRLLLLNLILDGIFYYSSRNENKAQKIQDALSEMGLLDYVRENQSD